ncbi:MAG: FAD-binding oxidoreductase [Pseudomonadota bacterium]|uniref:FAD-binding oxidoreductase n=1 Tax=Phenylobacterium sp. TaxID=1871053 RepID=UPI0025D4C41E|nr:FAD-binding oxidoreductase [Phenylobacterium sp.]MBT9469836.1 FAD-binding oxidoreductase [Phenylobacterium sp.]
MPDDLTQASLADTLRKALGADRVATDEATRDLFSQDIWSKAPAMAELVAAPADTAALAQAVKAASAQGYGLAIRGGGMSYTNGYVPQQTRAVVLDLARMDRVLKVDAEAMTVTVEAGCTWKTLLETLKPLGLRTPFWGPLSGITSTVGGGLSQLNAIFGSGHYGTTSESVVGLTVVLADGEILRTGAGLDTPFYRHYGPDLTGLFCGDCGVFGVKAEITLRLIRAPNAEAYASFGFKDRSNCVAAMAEIARSGLACEMFGFDPSLARARLKRASLMADVKTLGKVVANQGSLFKGVKEAAKIALAGRSFVGDEEYSVHMVFEGRSEAAVEADLAAARLVVKNAGGSEIENTIPKVIRAQPFTPLNNILGAGGERWVPVHGIVSLAKADRVYAEIEAWFESLKTEFEREGVETSFMLTTMSTNGFLIEPVFTWPEARNAIHDATIEPGMLSKLEVFASNPAATDVVAKARLGVIDIFVRNGAAHFQIGRTYPYRESRDAASVALLDAVKATLDPKGTLNAGGLGFAR